MISTLARDRAHRLAVMTMVVALISALLGAVAGPAGAEITEQRRGWWGVDGLGPSSSTNVKSEVWAIEQIGNTVYVGGRFTHVKGGPDLFDQPYLAAFHADNGQWINWWRPEINAPVFALEASPDGSRLFVGGEFTSVNGVATTAFTALDPATGDTDGSWPVEVSGAGVTHVRDFDVEGEWLYIGGSFNRISAAGQGSVAYRAARANWSTAAIDHVFKPVVQGGGVWGIDASSSTDRVYLAGRFDSVNLEAETEAVAYVDTTTGAQVPDVEKFTRNDVRRNYAHDVESANGLVFIGGSQHYLNVYRESDMTLVKSHFTNARGGDFQDIEVVGDRVYASCHCSGYHWSSDELQLWSNRRKPDGPKTDISAIIAYSAITGEKIDTYAPEFSFSAGPWAIHGNPSDGCLWIGGDMRTIGGKSINKMIRTCDETGPGPAAGPRLQPPLAPPVSCTATPSGSDVEITWTSNGDDGATSHVIRRSRDGGPNYWAGSVPAPTSTFTNTGVSSGTYTYTVESRQGGRIEGPITCDPAAGLEVNVISPALPVTACQATPNGNDILITWTPANNGNDNATTYLIRRARNNATNYWAGVTQAGTTQWTNTNVTTPGTYTYTIESRTGTSASTPTPCTPLDGVPIP